MKQLFQFLPLCALGGLLASPVVCQAQGRIVQELTRLQPKPVISAPLGKLTYVGGAVPPVNAVFRQAVAPRKPVLTTEVERVALSDGRTHTAQRHSIVPSAVTILGSPAMIRPGERNISALRQQAQEQSTAQYLAPLERARWRHEWEALRKIWVKTQPSNIEDLPRLLRHQVPPPTLAYLQQEYTNLVALINQTQKELAPKVIYSFLRNEGHPFTYEERAQINQMIAAVRFKISPLVQSINKDPYLLVQQKYWDRMFGAFNPLLKGVLAKPMAIFRQDNRKFVLTEFSLHNPDGSSPYLPNSDSMIVGESFLEDEDDDFDEEQYSGTTLAMQRKAAKIVAEREHKKQMIALAEQERDALLQNIPEGLHIAVLNDDLLPLLNFKDWAKHGYLGKNATVTTYRDGFNFLKDIRAGARYDIVITDLVLPDGGVAMMEDFRILDSNAIVFASSKFYPGDGDDHSASDLFNFGMDGYVWNNTNLNEGAFGYLQYLRQLNNYYYYKNKYGWSR